MSLLLYEGVVFVFLKFPCEIRGSLCGTQSVLNRSVGQRVDMGGEILDGFFESFLSKKSLFSRKEVLQSSYYPSDVLHREAEIKQVANTLAPALRGEKPSNLFMYGKTGTGKTLTAKYVTQKMEKIASEKGISLSIVYTNCKLKRTADTEYRLLAQLLKEFGKEVPVTGLPTEELYKMFYSHIENLHHPIIVILDEIDYLVQRVGDAVLYNLTRMHEASNAHIGIVGISNDVTFVENLDPRVRSSLSEEEIIFPPYNALQIQEILRVRSEEAFNEGALKQGVIEKCAAYAAREHGDARRALELLRVAGDIANRDNDENVLISHIDAAEQKIDRDRIYDIISTQPKQYHLVLYSIFALSKGDNSVVFTGDIYSCYKEICTGTSGRALTQRRVSDIIAEFDMLGVINARTISKGRYGRTREIALDLPRDVRERVQSFLKTQLNM